MLLCAVLLTLPRRRRRKKEGMYAVCTSIITSPDGEASGGDHYNGSWGGGECIVISTVSEEEGIVAVGRAIWPSCKFHH